MLNYTPEKVEINSSPTDGFWHRDIFQCDMARVCELEDIVQGEWREESYLRNPLYIQSRFVRTFHLEPALRRHFWLDSMKCSVSSGYFLKLELIAQTEGSFCC